MYKKVLCIVIALAAFFVCAQAMAGEKEFSKDQIVAIATTAVKGEGVELREVDIIYDEGNKLWVKRVGEAKVLDASPNYGVLERGFLKNYRTVYFDFKEPLKDIWVFIDKDTGEVLEVYRE